MRFSRKSIIFILFVFLNLWCFSEPIFAYTVLKNGPVHEAYMTKELGALVLQAVPKAPPPVINERIPMQTDLQSQWISGYWAWWPEKNDFIWVSGLWRIPPPAHYWIEGYWKRYKEGWVWIQGFWSRVQADDLNYILPPPFERIDDDVPEPPAKDYFWVPGSWLYNREKSEYEWYTGEWLQMDHSWVLIPPHYYWRPGGYVYIQPYWDWPNPKRGTLYVCIDIPHKERLDLIYEPKETIGPNEAMKVNFPYFPHYILHFMHHYFYHADYWRTLNLVPSWWPWQKWWTFTFENQWDLWWWFSHPGYPAPNWLSEKDTAQIFPPNSSMLDSVKNAIPPPIVTSKGVVDQTTLIKAIKQARNATIETFVVAPIMPADPKKFNEIQQIALDISKEKPVYLKPMGDTPPANFGSPFTQQEPLKPKIKQDTTNIKFSNMKVPIPPKPKVINKANGMDQLFDLYAFLAQNIPGHYLQNQFMPPPVTYPGGAESAVRAPVPSDINVPTGVTYPQEQKAIVSEQPDLAVPGEMNPLAPMPVDPRLLIQEHRLQQERLRQQRCPKKDFLPCPAPDHVNHQTAPPPVPSTTQPITPNPPTQSNYEKIPGEAPENPLPKVNNYIDPSLLPPPPVPSIRKNNVQVYPLPQAQQDEGFLMNHPQPQRNPGPSTHNSRGFRPRNRGYNPAYP